MYSVYKRGKCIFTTASMKAAWIVWDRENAHAIYDVVIGQNRTRYIAWYARKYNWCSK